MVGSQTKLIPTHRTAANAAAARVPTVPTRESRLASRALMSSNGETRFQNQSSSSSRFSLEFCLTRLTKSASAAYETNVAKHKRDKKMELT